MSDESRNQDDEAANPGQPPQSEPANQGQWTPRADHHAASRHGEDTGGTSTSHRATDSSDLPAHAKTAGRAKATGKAKERKTYPWWVEIPVILLVTMLILGMFNIFIGRLYLIPSESMEPTLHGCQGCSNDRIFVNKLAYRGDKEPNPGDVVVFVGEDSWNTSFVSQRSSNSVIRGLENAGSVIGLVAPDENTLVKRVIATGGQTVQCQAGDPGIMVDGKKIDDSYTMNPPVNPIDRQTGSEECQGDYFGPVTVPDHHLWMMGDNRTNSQDSRAHMGDELQGTISVDNVVGKVPAVVLPFNRIGTVDSLDIQN